MPSSSIIHACDEKVDNPCGCAQNHEALFLSEDITVLEESNEIS